MKKETARSGVFEEHLELWRGVRLVGSSGMMLVLTVLLAGGGGWLLDRYLHTGAAGMAVCMLGGAVVALIWIARRVSRILLAMSRHPQSRSAEREQARAEAGEQPEADDDPERAADGQSG